MKRYWKMFMMISLIIVCIGTYYIITFGEKSTKFYLKMLEGNEKETTVISLQARYMNQQVSIHPGGNEYLYNRSYWNMFVPDYYHNKELEKLQKDYRQFMRGKGESNALYEDEQVIGYVNMNQQYNLNRKLSRYKVNVSVYDKDQKHSSSFNVLLDEENVYNYINLNDVQIVGDNLTIVTMNHTNQRAEVHLYSMNLAKNTLEEDKVILSNHADLNISGINDWGSMKSNRYAAFRTSYSQRDAGTMESTLKSELFVYDLETKEEVMIREEFLESIDQSSIIQIGDELISEIWTPTGPRIIRYSLSDKKVKNDITITFKDGFQYNKERPSLIANNRVYTIINTINGDQGIAIADLDTGKLVYYGVVSRKDNEKIRNLMIENISLK